MLSQDVIVMVVHYVDMCPVSAGLRSLNTNIVCEVDFIFFYRIANLKIQLAKLDSEAWPGVLDSERDRLILINEKEELLKEMRFISPRKWTRGEVERLEIERKRLEEDLQAARDTQSKALTERYVTRCRGKFKLLAERENKNK